jgi:hypothetical protein
MAALMVRSLFQREEDDDEDPVDITPPWEFSEEPSEKPIEWKSLKFMERGYIPSPAVDVSGGLK